MTPWHALQLALAGEKQALAFFTSIVEKTNDAKIKEMAAEFVEEEAEHVNLVHRLLKPLSQAERKLGRRSGSARVAGIALTTVIAALDPAKKKLRSRQLALLGTLDPFTLFWNSP